jgi:hypothetical protein
VNGSAITEAPLVIAEPIQTSRLDLPGSQALSFLYRQASHTSATITCEQSVQFPTICRELASTQERFDLEDRQFL